MNTNPLKIVFFVLSFVILITMALVSRDAGISGDEDLHLKQSELVYRYYATWGEDKSSMDTPKTHLKYYGQSLDNVTTILGHWFQLEDIYAFRHLVCSFTGWLAIFITAFFVVQLAGYLAGIITLLLFLVSPFFLGHSMNNLKDIPFALAYIASIYFIIQFFSNKEKSFLKTSVLLAVSIAFAFSIRAGGLLLFFYFWLYFILHYVIGYINNKGIDYKEFRLKIFQVFAVSISAYFLGLILWPYALQNPILNPWKSYQVMANFPTTLRQIFEGQSYWSDFLPWYYLPKYMGITIPLVVFLGIVFFFVFIRKIFHKKQMLVLSFVVFSILFPVVFVILKKSNLYGCWRHFIFIYPEMVVISAIGFSALFSFINSNFNKWALGLVMILLCIHPVRFMIRNHPYYYLYYNQFEGGLKGAYGKYETDYYYHSVRKASEWLGDYLKSKKMDHPVKVGSNFSIQWFFRNQKNISTSYFPYDERSRTDWDYAIVVNSYVHPDQLKNKSWPPGNTIHEICVDGVPVCAILERPSKSDFEGIAKLESGEIVAAIPLLEEGLKATPQNQYLWYKYAWALYKSNRIEEAQDALNSGLKVLPDDELILQFMGDIALEKGDSLVAPLYYERAINANCKFLRPYVKLAKLYLISDRKKARLVLMKCLRFDSRYKPAILALADTYRTSDPDIAKKYDQLANSIK
jgi:MFS family permease